MALKLKTAPAVEPLSATEVKAHLRVDSSDEDTLIGTLITAARQYCETFQSRAYITQTWELWLDAFPSQDYIKVPLPPLQAASIKYYDIDDTEAIFSADDYFVDTKSEPGWLVLNAGCVWPSTILRPANGVYVQFIVGYGDAGSDVPEKVKQAMLLLIGAWYEQREAITTTGLNVKEVPFAVNAILWQDRVF